MNIVCAVDLGSSSIKVIIARFIGMDIEILGIGRSESRGIKNAEILNMEHVCTSIKEAISEAEKMCGITIQDVYTNISGVNVKGENSMGIYVISNEDRIITKQDVSKAVENATNINLQSDYEIIHVLSREYIVDKKKRVTDPIGMPGFRLESIVHIVSAPKIQINNIYKVFSKLGLKVNDIILNSIASSESVLNEDEKNAGCILIDFGFGTTDVIVYVDGGVFHTFSLPLGSVHLTSDLEYAFKIPFQIAEFVKRRDGIATRDDVDPTEKVEIPSTIDNPKKFVHLIDLALVLESRVEEIFEIIFKILKKRIDISVLRGGVILTGGGSLLQGTEIVAEKIFHLPARIGNPHRLKGLSSEISSPEYATAVGILEFIFKQNLLKNETNEGIKKLSSKDKKIIHKLKSWISENI